MKRLLVLLSIFCLQGAICRPQQAQVQVDLSQAGKKVSPNQFGIFFEEINHAGDGGLYAELIRNGSVARGEDPGAGQTCAVLSRREADP